jgi:beta-lactamase superfamily II metal-dependent hydrolase
MIDRITIRMYRVGFGDCFLLKFWTGLTATKVLIDCGTITEGQPQLDKVTADVISECRDADNVIRINLVVATHRHRDHVAGFSSAVWSQVEAGEVWMPWTEDPNDPDATEIRNRQSALAAALAPKDQNLAPLAGRANAASPAECIQAMALNALTNEKAMATLHGGFAKKVAPVFLPGAATPFEVRTVTGIDDVKVHVLGPSRDKSVIAVMDPPQGKGYLTAPGAAQTEAQAFGFHWRSSEKDHRKAAPGSTFSVKDMTAIQKQADQPGGELAAALDNAVNNTSLILMFEVGDQFLLFPGDAQWGSWNAALTNPAAHELLAKTNFYKVGHHGSHNATPRELIESLVQPPFAALFSTCHVKQWPDIPRQPLLDAIKAKAKRWSRSDDDAQAATAGLKVVAGLYQEIELTLAPPGGPPPAAGAPPAAKP